MDALLPTIGGQTGLNCAMEAHERGILARHGVVLIGASPEAIAKAEDRQLFKAAMQRIGLDVPEERRRAHPGRRRGRCWRRWACPASSGRPTRWAARAAATARRGRSSSGPSSRGLKLSRISEVLVEEGLFGWKEFELEVIRDRVDNVVIVCSIENIDPMGVHTGDSITVAPAQTLSDREYQQMRDAAKAIMREIGVDTGGQQRAVRRRPAQRAARS